MHILRERNGEQATPPRDHPAAEPLKDSFFSGVLVAFAVVSIATLVRLVLVPVAGTQYVFALFFGAVAVASVVGGLWAGVAAILLSALSVSFVFLTPLGLPTVTEPRELVALATFIAVSSAIVSITVRMRQSETLARQHAARAEERFRLLNQASVEREIAERLLIASERRFRLIAENAHDLIAMISLDGRYLYASPSFTKVLGYLPEELYQMGPGHLIHPDDAVDTARTPDGKERQFRLRRKDGGYIEVEGSEYKVDAEEESFRVSIARDVTERNKHERSLRESEHRFRMLAETGLIGVILGNSKGEVTYVNEAFAGLLGYSRTEMMTPGFDWDGIHPPDYHGVRESIQKKLRAGEPVEPYRKDYVHREGHLVPVMIAAARISSEIDEVAAFVTDLTSLEKASREVQQSEERWRFLAEFLPQIVWTALPDGTVDYYNSRLEEFTGVPASAGTGSGWQMTPHPDDLQKTVDAWQHSVETGEPYEIEHRIRRPDGSYAWFLSRAAPHRDAEGNILKWFGSATDVSELKAAQEAMARAKGELEKRVLERTEELQQAYEEMEGFCYSVSHDMRTPARAISAHSNMVVHDYSSLLDDEGKASLLALSDAAVRMGHLIDDLLEFARLGRQHLKADEIDLSALAAEVLAKVKERHPGMRWNPIVEEGCLAHGDRTLMTMVLDNLFDNACKYARAGVPLEVEFGRVDSQKTPTYFVKDNGIGFEMKYASRLFKPFERLHREADYPGTGIGLANVRRIIEKHGGKAWAEAAPNEGATFFFTLPEPNGSRSRKPSREPRG